MKISIKINDEEFLLLRNKTKNADCDLCDFKEHCNALMPQMRMLPCITFAESFLNVHNNIYFAKTMVPCKKQ